MNIDQLIRTAIEQRKLIRLRYNDKDRVVEPHDYGIHNGIAKLLSWQTKDPANWRWFQVANISNAELLDQTFSGGRGIGGQHHKWDELYMRVKPSASNQDSAGSQ